MSTKADFYVGRDTSAKWLGSISWDGMPLGIPLTIRSATTEDNFRSEVEKFLTTRADAATPEQGWPWKWDSSHGTNYTYAYDVGKVWTCCYGSSWWDALKDEPEHTSLKRKGARLPDMSDHRKLAPGHPGKRILVIK